MIDATQSISMNSISEPPSLARGNEIVAGDFRNAVMSGLQEINQQLTTADTTMRVFAAGGDVSTHELMIAMEKAKFSMEVAVEVRNKVVEAYQEFMRMQL